MAIFIVKKESNGSLIASKARVGESILKKELLDQDYKQVVYIDDMSLKRKEFTIIRIH
jgi:hypothetical protein